MSVVTKLLAQSSGPAVKGAAGPRVVVVPPSEARIAKVIGKISTDEKVKINELKKRVIHEITNKLPNHNKRETKKLIKNKLKFDKLDTKRDPKIAQVTLPEIP